MTSKTKTRILAALKADCSRAADNAARFRAAFRGRDAEAMAKEYGESGHTCGALLKEVEHEEEEALAALGDFQSSVH